MYEETDDIAADAPAAMHGAAVTSLAAGKTIGVAPEADVYFIGTGSEKLSAVLALFGWMVQLALGVAFWILPRFPQGPPRGNETLIWLSFALLNLGIACVVAGTVLVIPGFSVAGRTIEFGGVLAFAVGSWRRVRPTMI